MKTVNSKQTLNSRIFENQLLLYVPKEPQNDPKIVEKNFLAVRQMREFFYISYQNFVVFENSVFLNKACRMFKKRNLQLCKTFVRMTNFFEVFI